MKRVLLFIALALAVVSADAQAVRTVSVPDTLTNTDTSVVSFNSIGSKVKSFQVTAKKISGTISCTVYLQGTVDGIAWSNLDSLVMANNTTTQTKVVTISATSYNSYRSNAITAGTQSFWYTIAVLRRPDE